MLRDDRADTLSYSQIWGTIAIRWRLIAAIVAAGALIAGIQAVASDPGPAVGPADPFAYNSRATYMTVVSGAEELPAEERVRLSQSLAGTYAIIMGSPGILDEVARATGVEVAAGQFAVHAVPETTLLNVSATAATPGEAAAVANEFAAAIARSPGFGELEFGSVRVGLEVAGPATAQGATPLLPPAPGKDQNPFFVVVPISVFLGLLAVFVVEWIDKRANWPRQVEGETGLIAIGSLEGRRSGVPPAAHFVSGGAREIEAFRSARARLKSLMPQRGRGASILVTSPEYGDGKTTVVANLASALAEDGSKVIVVSSDFRSRAAIEDVWPGDVDADRPGLSDYLLDGSLAAGDIVAGTDRAGVELIRRGSDPEAALALLDSRRMAGLVRALCERADWALFDSPPTGKVADAARVAATVDGTLLIVDGTRSTLPSIRDAAEQLGQAGANLLGFFHNRARGNPFLAPFRH